MVVNTERLVIELETRGTARMKDVAGTRIDCLRGRIWITEEGVKDDQILDAGESHIISRKGLAVVQALREAVIGIRSPAICRAGVVDWIARSFWPAARARGPFRYTVGIP